MFLRANVQGVDMLLLVDTGATVTLVSNEIVKGVGKWSMANVDTMCENVYDAGGKELDMSGKGRFAYICIFEAHVYLYI